MLLHELSFKRRGILLPTLSALDSLYLFKRGCNWLTLDLLLVDDLLGEQWSSSLTLRNLVLPTNQLDTYIDLWRGEDAAGL